jgi:NADH-quinone oxidoreductase subunit H
VQLTLISILVVLGKSILFIVVLLGAMAYMTWLERRVVAFIQVRLGPNRVGYEGLLQPIADGIKLLFKEEIVPRNADFLVYMAAPAIALIAAFMTFSVIPVTQSFFVSNTSVGVMIVLAISSLGTYGVILAGWSSGSKYPFLGGIRSCSQMISYELAFGMSIVSVVILAGSLNLVEIGSLTWKFPYAVVRILAFVIFLISAYAETNRAPFDLPEAENELVAGYHTEYSSMKFAMFFLGEYVNMINASAVATVLFLGGWRSPVLPELGFLWFLIKVGVLLFVFIWVRATLPRFRFDQLTRFGWMVLLPAALSLIVIAAGLKAFAIK